MPVRPPPDRAALGRCPAVFQGVQCARPADHLKRGLSHVFVEGARIRVKRHLAVEVPA